SATCCPPPRCSPSTSSATGASPTGCPPRGTPTTASAGPPPPARYAGQGRDLRRLWHAAAERGHAANPATHRRRPRAVGAGPRRLRRLDRPLLGGHPAADLPDVTSHPGRGPAAAVAAVRGRRRREPVRRAVLRGHDEGGALPGRARGAERARAGAVGDRVQCGSRAPGGLG